MSDVSQEQLSSLAQRVAVVETLTRDQPGLRERLTAAEVQIRTLQAKIDSVESGVRKVAWTVGAFVLMQVLNAVLGIKP